MSRRLHLFTPAALLLLAWGVFAFGAVYTWAHVPLLIFGVAVATLGFLAARATGTGGLRPYLPLAISLTLVFAAGVIQIVPLPASVVTAISPARDDADYDALFAQRTMREHDPAAPQEPPRTLSIEPSRTVLGLAFVAGLTMLLLGAANGFSAVRPTSFVRGVIVIGVGAAFAALVQSSLTGYTAEYVYGFFPPMNAFGPMAPFMNRNHTAGFLVMTTAVSLGYMASCVAVGWRRVKPEWRERMLWLASREASEALLVGFGVMVMATAIIATRSRSGAGTLALALITFGILVVRRTESRAGKLLVLIPPVIAIALAASFGGIGGVLKRFETMGPDVAADRPEIWRSAIAEARDFPLAGTGLNTFGVASLHYQDPERGSTSIEAHNDYLQIASEGGLLLGIPALAAILSLAVLIRRRFRERTDDLRLHWLRTGAVIGLLCMAAQSLVEFTLQMPGAAALFVFLAAMAMHRGGP